jgi:protein deglycase
MNDALIVLPHGFEEIEGVTPIDLLRRANLDVKVAALNYPIQVTGQSRLEMMADGPLDAFLKTEFRAIVLIGGPGSQSYIGHTTLLPLLKAHKGILAAICAAPIALNAAGLLAGKRYTCHPSRRNELKEALDEPVVVDGRIITAAGPGAAFAFGLELIKALEGSEKANEIAGSTEYLR